MRLRLLTTAVALLALAACDKAKPRHPPPDPFAAPPPQAAAMAPQSSELPRRPAPPVFGVEHIGAAFDPRSRQPAVTPAGQPIVVDGFGFDPVGRTPAKGVDVVVDGRAYGAAYGSARQDVASYFKAPWLLDTGFTVTLPAESVRPGAHTVAVRVISRDGKAYFEGPPIPFQVSPAKSGRP